MKIFTKITAFFIIASFIFSGEVFARKHIRHDTESTSTTRRAMRKLNSIEKKKIRPTSKQAQRARLRKEEQKRALRNRIARGKVASKQAPAKSLAAPKARPRTHAKPVRLSAAEKSKAAARAKAKTRGAPSFIVPEQNGQWKAVYELNDGTIVTRTSNKVQYGGFSGKGLHLGKGIVINGKQLKNDLNLSTQQSQAEFLRELAKHGGIKKVTRLP